VYEGQNGGSGCRTRMDRPQTLPVCMRPTSTGSSHSPKRQRWEKGFVEVNPREFGPCSSETAVLLVKIRGSLLRGHYYYLRRQLPKNGPAILRGLDWSW